MKTRIKRFVREMGISITSFCNKAKISRSTYYRWIKDGIAPGKQIEDRVDRYLKKYGF